MKRRALLLAGAGAAGALVVGWSLLPPRERIGRPDELRGRLGEGPVALNGWIQVQPDGRVHLAMPRSEMGQGVHTALAMLVAEELDLRLDQLTLVGAGTESLYGNVAAFEGFLPVAARPDSSLASDGALRAGAWIVGKLARELGLNLTGGSSSVADAWPVMRTAAATARARLLGAASLQWRLPAAELRVRDGVVTHDSGARAHFGDFARAAAATPPGEVRLKPRTDWRLIGQPLPRLEGLDKSQGRAGFGLDVRPEGLVYAVVRHCPMIGGAPGALDPAAALALPGVERVVRLGPYAGSTPGLAVVGRTTWHAQRGAQALEVEWMAPPAGAPDTAEVLADLERRAREAAVTGDGLPYLHHGDAAAALAGAARRMEAVYRAPYLAHVTMEPPNATAQVLPDRVIVWAPTQVPGLARRLAAEVAGVSESAVTVNVTYLGGGFGRRLEVDVIGQAVRVAMETGGRPVQLVWPRAEDLGHDFYRPAGVAVMQAGFDGTGRLVAWQAVSAGDAVVPRWMSRVMPALATRVDMPDKTTAEGLLDMPYDVPHRRAAHVATRSGVPVGYWRSVGHSHNAFFAEAFADELAHAAGLDPVQFRLGLLEGLPRHAAVLRLAAERADWGQPLPAGRARGVALHASFGSLVAQVMEISLQTTAEGPQPRVYRVVCAVDCGTVVNPQLVAQQVESSVVFGLTAALWGGVDIVGGRVRQQNLPDHPLLTLAQTPAIETHFVPSEAPPSGMGEPAVPPVAPALANALFALTGRRLRQLPLQAALKAAMEGPAS